MRRIDNIVIHCTATPQTTTIESIRNYWKKNLGWQNPGYHFLIKPNGEAVNLQPIDKPSNGVAGHNANSIHLSYIGGVDGGGKAVDNRTIQQKETLLRLVKQFKAQFPAARVLGHRDFSPDRNGNGKVDSWERIKECPCFDAIPEYKTC